MTESKRIPQLDGVRGLAILMVILTHYVQNRLLEVPGPLAKYVAKSLSLAWSGVDLFFVLSGFLICGILVDNDRSFNFFRTFYARRAVRILPPYLLMLGFFVIGSRILTVPGLFDNPLPLWSYATFTQNILLALVPPDGLHWFGHSWSLAVEEQFYLILPLVVWVMPRRALIPMFVLGAIFAVVLRSSLPWHQYYVLTAARADSLLLGAILALLVRSSWFPEWFAARKRIVLVGFGILLIGAAAMTAKPWATWSKNHLWLAFLYTTFLLIAITNSIPVLTRVLSSAGLVWVGKVSYVVYLIHGDVAGIVFWTAAGKAPQLMSWMDIGITVLCVAVTFALAAFSFRFLEAPLLAWGRRFKYDAKPLPGKHCELARTA